MHSEPEATSTEAATATKIGHTPGPWMVEPHSDTDEVLSIVADYRKLPSGIKQAHWIAECDAGLDFGDDAPEVLARNKANARLIAAAPELLRLLKIAQPEWCSMRCPSVFRGPDSARHLAICDEMRAVIHGCGGSE